MRNLANFDSGVNPHLPDIPGIVRTHRTVVRYATTSSKLCAV